MLKRILVARPAARVGVLVVPEVSSKGEGGGGLTRDGKAAGNVGGELGG